MDRGTRGMSFILSAAVFNVLLTFLEVAAVTAILTYTCGPALGGLTLATLGGGRRGIGARNASHSIMMHVKSWCTCTANPGLSTAPNAACSIHGLHLVSDSMAHTVPKGSGRFSCVLSQPRVCVCVCVCLCVCVCVCVCVCQQGCVPLNPSLPAGCLYRPPPCVTSSESHLPLSLLRIVPRARPHRVQWTL